MTKISTLGGWGPITVGTPSGLGAIFDIRGDPYDHNCRDPREVGTNHGGDPLVAILDIREEPL